MIAYVVMNLGGRNALILDFNLSLNLGSPVNQLLQDRVLLLVSRHSSRTRRSKGPGIPC